MSRSVPEPNSLERLLRPLEMPPAKPEAWLASATGAAAGHQSDGQRTELVSDGWHLFASAVREGNGRRSEIASFTLPGGGSVSASVDPRTGSIFVPFSFADVLHGYLAEEWIASANPRRLSTRQLNLFYRVRRFVPRSLQLATRRRLIRWQGVPEFPAWPLDLSVSRLFRFYAYCRLSGQGKKRMPFRWFWPDSYTAALILTHDVESAAGLRLAVELADLEEELGFRSSFNLGGWYAADPGIVRDLRDRGFEIGVHGLRHDRSLFGSRASFEAQQPALARLAKSLDASGFRSPSTYRVFEWMAELPFSYDGSIPHSDPFEPQPGGCCSLWPFFIGPLVELPYTLPQDHTLFTLLEHRTIDLWISQAARIEEEHGLIHCLSHPDRGYLAEPGRRALYAEFLRGMTERTRVWKALPADVASWWRLRDGDADDGRVSEGAVQIGNSAAEISIEPPSEPVRPDEERVPGSRPRSFEARRRE
jgi:peptidoglycan/xylan/chitin deacetylase (PgdA/CDA1 family)